MKILHMSTGKKERKDMHFPSTQCTSCLLAQRKPSPWAAIPASSILPVGAAQGMAVKDHPASPFPAPHLQWPPLIVKLLNKGRPFSTRRKEVNIYLFIIFNRRKSSKSLITCIHGRDPGELNSSPKWLNLSP